MAFAEEKDSKRMGPGMDYIILGLGDLGWLRSNAALFDRTLLIKIMAGKVSLSVSVGRNLKIFIPTWAIDLKEPRLIELKMTKDTANQIAVGLRAKNSTAIAVKRNS